LTTVPLLINTLLDTVSSIIVYQSTTMKVTCN